MTQSCLVGIEWFEPNKIIMVVVVLVVVIVIVKNVRQLETAERQLPPKCTNFGFFTTKMYEFWVFYHQSVRILGFFKEMYEYWGVN